MLPPTVHPVNKNIIFVVSYYEPVKYKIPLDISVDRVDVKYAKDKGIIRMEYRYKNNNGEADIRVVEHNCRENPDLVVNTNVDVSFITSME